MLEGTVESCLRHAARIADYRWMVAPHLLQIQSGLTKLRELCPPGTDSAAALALAVHALELTSLFRVVESAEEDGLSVTNVSRDELRECISAARMALLGYFRRRPIGGAGSPEEIVVTTGERVRLVWHLVERYRRQMKSRGGQLDLESAVEMLGYDVEAWFAVSIPTAALAYALQGSHAEDCDDLGRELGLNVDFARALKDAERSRTSK